MLWCGEWKIESMQVVFETRSPIQLTLLRKMFHMAIIDTSLYLACLFLPNEDIHSIFETLREADTTKDRQTEICNASTL